jgi:hypothetical protein
MKDNDNCVSYLQTDVLMSVMIVNLKLWKVTVTSLQLFQVKSRDIFP